MEQHQMPLLPVLNEAELHAIFQHDERAIWRYQILAALLHQGLSIREAAQQHGTTSETVRTLYSTFLATGHLDILRSKRRGAAGHLDRQTPLAQAVARALAADPTASGSAIWHRVQQQLAASAIQVPRRSVYRLVERLRSQAPSDVEEPSQSDLWAPGLVPALRTALPLLMLEPPIDLGQSQLATTLFPQETEALARGQMLRTMLLRGLETLRPAVGDDPQSPAARAYHILIGEAFHGAQREELEHQLAIAPATYTRAKRQGLEQLAENLVQHLQRDRAPIMRASPPALGPFVGRERELNYYAQRLVHEGIAVIWGLGGAGKTMLATALATQQQSLGEIVIWHTCEGADDAILRSLLVSCGARPPAFGTDTTALLDAIRHSLPLGSLLVLDSFERIAADPVTTLLIAMLRSLAEQSAVRLLICSRQLPDWAAQQGWLPLDGLPEEGARAFWVLFGGQTVEPDVWHRLYDRTRGYPWLLESCLVQPDSSLAPLLLERLNQNVTFLARRVVVQQLLARRPLTSTINTSGSDTLFSPELYTELLHSGWLMYQPTHDCYHLHSLLQTHRDELITLIEDAPEIFKGLQAQALADQHWLDAVEYAAAAGDIMSAVRGIGDHLDEMLAQGDGLSIIALLKRLLRQLPYGVAFAEAQAQLGALHLALGAYSEALHVLQAAVELGAAFRATLPPLVVRRWHRLLAEAYLNIGHWRRALAHVQTSMGSERTITADVSPCERLALTILQHRIWTLAGQVEQARFWLADAQMHIQVNSCPVAAALVAGLEGAEALQRGTLSQARALLQQTLEQLPGAAYYTERFTAARRLAWSELALGHVDVARGILQQYAREAYAIGHQSGAAECMLGLVYVALYSGAYDEARTTIRIAETLLDPLNARLSAELRLAYGWLALHSDNTAPSLEHMHAALDLVNNPPIVPLQVAATVSLAFAYLQHGDASSAGVYARLAARQASAAGLDWLGALAALCLAYEATLRRSWTEVETTLAAVQLPAGDPLVASQYHWVNATRLSVQGASEAADDAFQACLHILQDGPTLLQFWVKHSYCMFKRSLTA